MNLLIRCVQPKASHKVSAHSAKVREDRASKSMRVLKDIDRHEAPEPMV